MQVPRGTGDAQIRRNGHVRWRRQIIKIRRSMDRTPLNSDFHPLAPKPLIYLFSSLSCCSMVKCTNTSTTHPSSHLLPGQVHHEAAAPRPCLRPQQWCTAQVGMRWRSARVRLYCSGAAVCSVNDEYAGQTLPSSPTVLHPLAAHPPQRPQGVQYLDQLKGHRPAGGN